MYFVSVIFICIYLVWSSLILALLGLLQLLSVTDYENVSANLQQTEPGINAHASQPKYIRVVRDNKHFS